MPHAWFTPVEAAFWAMRIPKVQLAGQPVPSSGLEMQNAWKLKAEWVLHFLRPWRKEIHALESKPWKWTGKKSNIFSWVVSLIGDLKCHVNFWRLIIPFGRGQSTGSFAESASSVSVRMLKLQLQSSSHFYLIEELLPSGQKSVLRDRCDSRYTVPKISTKWEF